MTAAEWRHPYGWRITRVVIAHEGPFREWLRLRWGRYFVGDYRSVEELAAALERRGYSLADFGEVPGDDLQSAAAGRRRWAAMNPCCAACDGTVVVRPGPAAVAWGSSPPGSTRTGEFGRTRTSGAV
jgi:hypothetical protein